MKKLLIIIFAFIAIKSQAQILGGATFGTWSSGTNVYVISKDTTFSDTTSVEYFAIDTINTQSIVMLNLKAYNRFYFIKGYRVDIRKGEYSSSMVQTGCDNPGCAVLHFKIQFNQPEIIKTYYLSGSKSEIDDRFYVKEIPLTNFFIKGL